MNNRHLDFHLYNNGHSGMCNILMSVELAVVLGMLTQRDPVLHAGQPVWPSSSLFIDDLFDVDGASHRHHSLSAAGPRLPPQLWQSCVTNGRTPSAEYLFGRSRIVDLRNYQYADRLSTSDDKTLGWYSYVYCLTDEERKLADAQIRSHIRPKQRYATHAKHVVHELRSEFGGFSSVHVRRGDYLKHGHFRGSRIAAKDFVNILLENFSKERAVLVHSDEEDDAYFDELGRHFPNLRFIDKELRKHYDDRAELGLVSLLIASHSDDFVGTMYSTFSELIRRYRRQNGMVEKSIYLYSQTDSLKLLNGRMIETKPGENIWNRIGMCDFLRESSFWWRDWYENAQHDEDAPRALLVA